MANKDYIQPTYSFFLSLPKEKLSTFLFHRDLPVLDTALSSVFIILVRNHVLLKAGQNLFKVIHNMIRKCEPCIALQKKRLIKKVIQKLILLTNDV